MRSLSSSAQTARGQPDIVARWLASIGFFLVLGSGALGTRLIWEMTVWSWERGPQMVGFRLVHGGGAILLFFPLLLVGWLAIAALHLVLHAWIDRKVSRACLVAMVLSVVMLGVLWGPAASYGFWLRMFADKLIHGPYAGEFVVEAAAAGDLATVETLVARGLALNTCDRWGKTALHGAAVRGHANVIQYLISAGADVNAVDRLGDSPLQLAIAEHHEESAKLLADHGAVAVRGSEEQRNKVIHEKVRQSIERTSVLHTDQAK
jgi:Ankyrin repeats (3 copies)